MRQGELLWWPLLAVCQVYNTLMTHQRVHQVAETLTTGRQWPQTMWFHAFTDQSGAKRAKSSTILLIHLTVRCVPLTSHVALLMMRPGKWPIACLWSVTAKSWRALHSVEPMSPFECRGPSITEIPITRTRAASWKHGAVPPSDDDTRVFGRYGWCHLRPASQRFDDIACPMCRAHTSRDALSYWLANRRPRLDHLYSTALPYGHPSFPTRNTHCLFDDQVYQALHSKHYGR